MAYQVNEMAKLAGVSIRTLRYYDQMGLLCPKRLPDSEYRSYSERDLERLLQILFLKELDFSLKEIRSILQAETDLQDLLRDQRSLLVERKMRLEKIIQSLDRVIESGKGVEAMKKSIKAFDMSKIEAHKKAYAQEVKTRYGKSDAYRESQQKTEGYSEKDWERITAEGDEILKTLAQLMDKDPKDKTVQLQVDRYRDYITRSFYTCTPEIFRGLGQMYQADPRYKEKMDVHGQGLTDFLSQAIAIYCDELELEGK